MKFLILLSALALAVKAQIQSPTYQFNVTSPTPNSPYVASQILPCVYDIASNTTSDNLQLSILLVGTNSSTPMVMSADISQGFSFQKKIDGAIVYEHQLNYNIPANTTAGSYEVVYLDNLTQTKVSIPITIGAAPAPTVPSSPAGSASSSPSSPTNNNIFNKENSANAGLQISKFILVASFILAFVHL